MTTLDEVYDAIAANLEKAVNGNEPIVNAVLTYRPRQFNTSPLIYIDVPIIEQQRMGRGEGTTPCEINTNVVLICSNEWVEAQQSTLRRLMPKVFAGLRLSLGIDGTSIYCDQGRGLRPGQFTEEDEGLPVGPVGAVFPVRIQAPL